MRLKVLLAGLFFAALGLTSWGLWLSQTVEVAPSVETLGPIATGSAVSSPPIQSPTESAATSHKVKIVPAEPQYIAIPELKFKLEVQAETLAQMTVSYCREHPCSSTTRAIYASDFHKASWPSDYGAMPASPAQGKAFFTCHSSAISDLPCNVLATVGTVHPGQHLNVTTRAGAVRYVITKVAIVKKVEYDSGLGGDVELTFCLLKDGLRTDSMFVVVGELEN